MSSLPCTWCEAETEVESVQPRPTSTSAAQGAEEPTESRDPIDEELYQVRPPVRESAASDADTGVEPIANFEPFVGRRYSKKETTALYYRGACWTYYGEVPLKEETEARDPRDIKAIDVFWDWDRALARVFEKSPLFPYLKHFSLCLSEDLSKKPTRVDRVIAIDNFFAKHCTSLEEVRVRGHYDDERTRADLSKLVHGLHLLLRLTALKYEHYEGPLPRPLLEKLPSLSGLRYLFVQCSRITSNTVFDAPNLEFVHIHEGQTHTQSEGDVPVTVDLSNLKKLVKVGFRSASGTLRLVLSPYNPSLRWLALRETVAVEGDLSTVAALELIDCEGADIHSVLARCRYSLRELLLSGGCLLVSLDLDFLRPLRVLMLKEIRVLVHGAQRSLEVLALETVTFAEDQQPLRPRRLWLSGASPFWRGKLDIASTTNLGGIYTAPHSFDIQNVFSETVAEASAELCVLSLCPSPSYFPVVPRLGNRHLLLKYTGICEHMTEHILHQFKAHTGYIDRPNYSVEENLVYSFWRKYLGFTVNISLD